MLRLGASLGACGSAVIIQNISKTGLQFETSATLPIGETVEVHLPEIGSRRATIVWRKLRLFGCRFDQPISTAVVSAVRLRSDPAVDPLHENDGSAGPYRLVDFADSTGRTLLISAALSAALLFAAAALLFTLGPSILMMAAAGLAVLFGLLLIWGLWVLDNTIDI